MRASDSTAELTKALSEAQAAFPTISKAKEGKVSGQGKNGYYEYSYHYADLNAVVDATRTILKDNGLAVSQFPDTDGTNDLLTTRLLHTSGEWIEGSMRLIATTSPQAQGSALTYARRYAYCAVLGIVADEDDDAQSAQNSTAANAGRTGSSRGQGGSAPAPSNSGRPAGAPPSRPSHGCPTQNPEHNQYSWCHGGKVPTPDAKAKKLSEGQIKRLFAIARNADVLVDDALAALWPDTRPDDLDWRQGKWLTEALEDGWRPAGAPDSTPAWTDVPETARYEGSQPYTSEPF